MYEKGYIKNFADLFKLHNHQQELEKLEGFAALSIQNLLDSIDKAKTITLSRFIYAMGIPQVGSMTALLLSRYCQKLDTFLNLKQLVHMEGIGASIEKDIIDFLHHPDYQRIIQDVINVIHVIPDTIDQDHFFNQKTVLLTGTLQSMGRLEAKKIIQNKGGMIATSISSKVDLLIYGDNPGSKLKGAMALNIPILTEDEFLTLIQK